jgi:hypothetical protein
VFGIDLLDVDGMRRRDEKCREGKRMCWVKMDGLVLVVVVVGVDLKLSVDEIAVVHTKSRSTGSTAQKLFGNQV